MNNNRNRVGMNLIIGTFWILAAIWMYAEKITTNACVAVIVVLGLMFYWAAFKIFKNPRLQKNNKNLMQKIADPNFKQSYFKKKK